MICNHTVGGLQEGGKKQDQGRDEGDERPWIVEIGMFQVGSPSVPPLLAVGIHLQMHMVERAGQAHGRPLG